MFIPLHGDPIDWSRMELLARAVMCGSHERCSVHFTRETPDVLVLADAMDPLLDLTVGVSLDKY